MATLLVKLSAPPNPSICRTSGEPMIANSTRSRTSTADGKLRVRKKGPLDVPPRMRVQAIAGTSDPNRRWRPQAAPRAMARDTVRCHVTCTPTPTPQASRETCKGPAPARLPPTAYVSHLHWQCAWQQPQQL